MHTQNETKTQPHTHTITHSHSFNQTDTESETYTNTKTNSRRANYSGTKAHTHTKIEHTQTHHFDSPAAETNKDRREPQTYNRQHTRHTDTDKGTPADPDSGQILESLAQAPAWMKSAICELRLAIEVSG